MIASWGHRTLILLAALLLLVIPSVNVSAYSSPYFASRLPELGYHSRIPAQVVAKGNNVYILSSFSCTIERLNLVDQQTSIVAGRIPFCASSPDGSIATQSSAQPSSIAVGNDGTVYFAEADYHIVRAILPDGTLKTVAGNGTSIDWNQRTDAPDARNTAFNNPGYIKVGPDNNLYISDNGVIRRILPDGSTDHVAGSFDGAANGNAYVEGGQANQHALMPNVIPDTSKFAFDKDGNLFYSNLNSTVIYKVDDSDGTVHTFATLKQNWIDTLEDQPSSNANLDTYTAFDIDNDGQIWTDGYSATTGWSIRYISPTGQVVKTAAGGGDTTLPPTYSPASIPGVSLYLPKPIKSISADSGRIYFISSYIDSTRGEQFYTNVLTTNTTPPADTTPPTITATRSPTPNASDWNNANVTVTYTCSDSQSGIASCSAPSVLSNDGVNQSASGTAVDNAGNSSSTTVSGINIDKTVPTATSGAINGWLVIHWANPTITANASDSLSGVVGGEYYIDTDPGQGNGKPMTYDIATGKIKASPVISSGSTGYHTIYMRSKDAAGNWSTTTSVQYLYTF